MLSFAKFRHFLTLHITSRILCPFCYLYGSFFKGILDDSCTLFVFCCMGVFLNNDKLSILMLITNMALKIQNYVIIRKQSKNEFANISAGK